MSGVGYLYSAVLIIFCTVIISGAVMCFFVCREREWLCIAALFVLYLFSEFTRVLSFLGGVVYWETPFGASGVWVDLCLACYLWLALGRLGRPLGVGERWSLAVFFLFIAFFPSEIVSFLLVFVYYT